MHGTVVHRVEYARAEADSPRRLFAVCCQDRTARVLPGPQRGPVSKAVRSTPPASLSTASRLLAAVWADASPARQGGPVHPATAKCSLDQACCLHPACTAVATPPPLHRRRCCSAAWGLDASNVLRIASSPATTRTPLFLTSS